MTGVRAVRPSVRAIARELAPLFERDRELCVALNAAQERLLAANAQLTVGLSAEALHAIYGPRGPDLGLSGRKPAVLEEPQPIAALERVAYTIRRAFIDYQNAAEERRQLACEVGEAVARLIAAMADAGFTEQEARQADVRALAAGSYRVGREPGG